MANNNQNGSSGLRGPDAIVWDYHKKTKDDRNAAGSRKKAAETKQDFKDIARGYKLCYLEKSEATHHYYRDVDNYEVFDMLKSTEIIQKNVDGYIKKNDEMEKAIQEASKMLNDMEKKLHDAQNAACAMQNCIKSRVPLGDPVKGTNPMAKTNPQELEVLKTALEDVMKSAKVLAQDSQSAAQAMAKIAGIQTFSNIDSLKDQGKKLGEKTKLLKTKVDECVKAATDDAKKAQEELTVVVDELNTFEFEVFKEDVVYVGRQGVLNFICEGECKAIGRVAEICQEVGSQTSGGTPGTNPAGSKTGQYSQRDQK